MAERQWGISLPGIGNSGAAHWQTMWELKLAGLRRFAPADWDSPDLQNWLSALDHAVADAPEPPVLVAHSLACLLVAHAAEKLAGRIAGALLVAVPDPEGPAFPAAATSFRNPPGTQLPFPAVIIASTDDPYGPLAHAERRAAGWNTGLAVLGPRGHINAKSDLGEWPEGLALLAAFLAGLGQRMRPS
jgi:predicted alpha/beta hydrolase family esterase